MEWINEIWSQVATYISIPYMLSFILLSFLIKRYFTEFLQIITNSKWKTVYTVLIIATILAIFFLLWSDIEWEQIVFSYTLGTSLHELVFTYVDKLFTTKK